MVLGLEVAHQAGHYRHNNDNDKNAQCNRSNGGDGYRFLYKITNWQNDFVQTSNPKF